MATKKIRVYELARELGVDNAVVVELSNELKIGVKSHSSSIDEPSADRVRRLADSRGLRVEVVPEPEPEPVPEPTPTRPPSRPLPSPRSAAVGDEPDSPRRSRQATRCRCPNASVASCVRAHSRCRRARPSSSAPRRCPPRHPHASSVRSARSPTSRRPRNRRSPQLPPLSVDAPADAAAPPARPVSQTGRPIPPPPGQRPQPPARGPIGGPSRSGPPRSGGPSGPPRTGGFAGRPAGGGYGGGPGGPGGPGGSGGAPSTGRPGGGPVVPAVVVAVVLVAVPAVVRVAGTAARPVVVVLVVRPNGVVRSVVATVPSSSPRRSGSPRPTRRFPKARSSFRAVSPCRSSRPS